MSIRTTTRTVAAVVRGAVLGRPIQGSKSTSNPPEYALLRVVSGSIKSGSDTMNNSTTLWAEGFPGACTSSVQVEIEGKGSSTAPPASSSLVCRPSAPMSRHEAYREGRIPK